MSRRKWKIASYDKDRAADISEEFCLDPFAALLLASRGITKNEDIENFLFSSDVFSDPFEICDMDRAVERIGQAIDNYEKIAIFGDYDADGVTSTALLYLYLSSQGADVSFYIPDRVNEGYGISESAIRQFGENGTKLIVTVDNGISAVEETKLANSLGMDVVITDHHKAGDILPPAVAVVNPHRADDESEFKDFAGVGVAFKLACALEGDSDTIVENYADLVAIGTLADVVPVVGENRAIIKKGIELINRNTRIGVESLRNIAGASKREFNASSVAYCIAPRINAAGRMKSAMLAMKLLLSDSPSQADTIAAEIDAANKERQVIENGITEQAIACIESNDKIKYAPVIVVSGENWHQGVIGIVASRLVSRYGKPAVVISTCGGEGKGSCRSIDGFSIYDALSSADTMLTHFGGHTLAAGFGIKTENIDDFREKICAYSDSQQMPYLSLNIDFKLKPSFITNELLIVLGLFEPYGAANPQPCFAINGVVLKAVRPVGEGKHLKLIFTKDGVDISAMLFSTKLQDFYYIVGDIVDIAFKIEKNEYRGEVKPSVHICDIRFSDIDTDKSFPSLRLYEKYRRGVPLNSDERKFITPDRNFLVSVYKFMKSTKNFSADIETFCERSGCPAKNAATVMVALDVLSELGLITNEDGIYKINENQSKVDLASSEILSNLACGG